MCCRARSSAEESPGGSGTRSTTPSKRAHWTPIARILAALDGVGLGYIRLGQPATLLSVGEAQRVKLARELCKRSTSRPPGFISRMWANCSRSSTVLLEKGNTVVVIEHNLEVIKTADWILDLGPESGAAGG